MRVLICLMAVFGLAQTSFAQSPVTTEAAADPQLAIQSDAPAGPRIGLVLGGGGARGFAHVGVLQVLEENRIPVHALAGTSMGAVVGSLYAQGFSPNHLHRITQDIPWDTVFDDSIERSRLPFRRKQDERDVLIDYRISFDSKGLVLPRGVLRGQDLFLTLAEYLAPARSRTDFDDLAIPFRAVASDLETGRIEVMGEGDIATAVFASMAVPGGLPPVERDGKLLVDGFVANNLPIDVARDMGVDRLIVVDVGTPLQQRDKLQSFFSVLSQLQTLLGYEAVERQLASLDKQDVVIRPDQPDVSTTNFGKSLVGIEAGRAAALAVLDQLRPYALSPEAWAAHIEARHARMPRKSPKVEFVRIENKSEVPTRQIEALVSQPVGAPLQPEAMTEDLRNIYGLGGFRSVRYRVTGAGDGVGDGVIITAEGDPTSANWLQVGLGISSDFDRESTLNLGLAYTDRNFKGTGLEWRTDVRVGTNILFETGFYAELGNSNPILGQRGSFFMEATPYWSRTDSILYQENQARSEVRMSRLGGRLEGGLLLGNKAELRLGLDYATVDVDTLIGPVVEDTPNITDVSWSAGLHVDTLDQVSFPTRGVLMRFKLEDHMQRLGGQLDYTTVAGDVAYPLTWGRTTVVLGGKMGFLLQGNGRLLGSFRQGGFLNLSGLNSNELIGRHMLLGTATVYHRFSEKAPLIDLPLYVGGSLEVGNTWASLADVGFDSLRPAGSLFVGADTPLGPFMLAAGLTRGSGAFYLVLGRIF